MRFIYAVTESTGLAGLAKTDLTMEKYYKFT